MFTRSSGVLLHISSLPSRYGIGGLGRSAFAFVDFLKRAEQSWWQVLPLGHTGYGDSPYQCFSAAAGNPYLIDLDLLAEDGLLTQEELNGALAEDPDHCDFGALYEKRWPLLRQAFGRVGPALDERIDAFCEENREWLPDYAFFMALKDHFGGLVLSKWPDTAIRARNEKAMRRYAALLADDIRFYEFLQYHFFTQWKALKAYANENGVRILGDLPIYVSADSADCWAHRELFCLMRDLSPKLVAGVPPDYYSATGQLWGNPLYNWKVHEETGFSWWIWRVRHSFTLFDALRIDHFRGFEAYWEIPRRAETAVSGRWRPGPRMRLFDAIRRALGELDIVAEDLGMIDDAVRAFVRQSGFPGMRVLIFGFGGDDNMHLPHNYPQNVVAYTSTHDSAPFCAEIYENADEAVRERALHYLPLLPTGAGWSAIRAVWASPAVLAIAPMQDVLSLGSDATMNRPATLGGNWTWRVRAQALNADVEALLADVTRTYHRAPPEPETIVETEEKEEN